VMLLRVEEREVDGILRLGNEKRFGHLCGSRAGNGGAKQFTVRSNDGTRANEAHIDCAFGPRKMRREQVEHLLLRVNNALLRRLPGLQSVQLQSEMPNQEPAARQARGVLNT
jgi:hypothetical protein